MEEGTTDDDRQEDALEESEEETDKKTEEALEGNQPCGSGGPTPGENGMEKRGKEYKSLGHSGRMLGE